MRSDIDEADLYPPDHEDLTPEARQHRNRVAIGAALVVWGVGLLVQRSLGVDLKTFWLGIGIGALAGWTQHRRYNWFCAGSIITGIGLSDLVTTPFHHTFGSTLSLLLIGAGFAAVYVRYPRRSAWALPVAAVFALLAVGAFGIALIGLVPTALGRFLLPLLLIGGGALLLMRHSLPPKTVKIGLAGLALTFVLVGTTSVPDIDRRDGPPFLGGGPSRPPVTADTIPDLAGRTLVLHIGSGDIRVVPAVDGVGHVSATPSRPTGDLRLRRDGGRDIVETGGRLDDADFVVTAPAGTKLDLETTSGSITGTLSGVRGNLQTSSGPIVIDLIDGGDEGASDEGPYELDTGSGRVQVHSPFATALDIETGSGGITVNGEPWEDEFQSPEPTGAAAAVEIDTGSGSVDATVPGSVVGG